MLSELNQLFKLRKKKKNVVITNHENIFFFTVNNVVRHICSCSLYVLILKVYYLIIFFSKCNTSIFILVSTHISDLLLISLCVCVCGRVSFNSM